ncbi:MAG TPA: D-glycero-beta-D-manno-heptose 1-phosphate adenylyltransferase [Humidesulfovibrio sp.]|uniref:D-glycero-beta-D-manno-heptose 1-phosphate adenylyltransferase n=1 Tax=Humidesulfovibrio sp. TaxID=2910988 RepID=UPI002C1BC3B2|nr:D-glycero-beta-D-manno-heptose 1-phosphate adenylyltransferase [Humidesulfovibrio sp.]HWR04331.1 D-glycero-beta-D-manno-heptose 1-phosphate adenylyltransferase [Humidesulfovibrio sp.]
MTTLSHPKILTLPEFLAKRAALPPDYRLVFTNGCYDILHPGHVDLLARARALGDGLILGLNSDASVRRIKGELPGPKRPVNSEAERAFVLAGLASVDFIVLFDEDTPLELIRAVRPQVLVKGGDWDVSRIVGRDLVEADGGRVVSLPLLPGYSTTGLIERLTR